MKIKSYISFVVLSCVSLFGQGMYLPSRTVTGTVNGTTRPVAGATITICAANTGGIPCSPALANTVYQTTALGSGPSLSNPFLTDQNGNYPQAAVAPGTYTVTESAPGYAGFSYQMSIPTSVASNSTTGSGSIVLGTSPLITTPTLTSPSITGITTLGTAPQVNTGGFVAVPQQLKATFASTSYVDINHAPWYFSWSDTTSSPTCLSSFLSPCDSALFRMDLANAQTGKIPVMVGMEIVGDAFAANDNTGAANTNSVIAYGGWLRDAGSANVTGLNTANFVVTCQSVPSKLGAGGFTRPCQTMQLNPANYSSTDAVFNGTIGNFIAGFTINANGNAGQTDAININSSISASGRGYAHGIDLSGVHGDYGYGIMKGGSTAFQPTFGYYAAAGSTAGFACGNGTITTSHDSAVSPTNPGDCLLADATSATSGPSNTINLRSTDAGGVQHEYSLGTDLSNNFHFKAGAVGALADKVIITSAGLIQGPNGSASGPAFSFNTQTSTGVFSNGAGDVSIANNGVRNYAFQSGGLFVLGNNIPIVLGGAQQTNLWTDSSGNPVLYIGNGTPQNASGTLNLATLNPNTGIVGVSTNSSAPSGDVGEIRSSQLPKGSAVSLTSGTATNVISVSLTAGDWDCSGAIDFTFGATTSVTNLSGSISQTSATMGAQDSGFDSAVAAMVPTAANDATFPVPVSQQLLASTNTIFLVAKATFSVSTTAAYGTIRCRRVR